MGVGHSYAWNCPEISSLIMFTAIFIGRNVMFSVPTRCIGI